MQLKQGLLQASSAVGALHPQRFFMRKSSMHIKIIGWAMAISMSGFALAQVKSIQAVPDSTVLEKLGPRLRPPVASADLIPAIRQAISLARQQADPRYLGQAQALIGQRWGQPDAGYDLLTLQATIEQSRHEFAQARKTLQLALKSLAPSYAQALLTLATIERVQGHYAAATQACQSIQEASAQLYANACLLETQSLQGQSDTARSGYQQLLNSVSAPVQQAWLYSLMAENEQRAGQSAAALRLFARSLALDNDGYTALAYADELLTAQQAGAVLALLANQPDSDAVLIRRAQALAQLSDARLPALQDTLNSRLASSTQRQDNAGHAREQAMYALYVQGDPHAALVLAKTNLELQREPVDWLIAVQSAERAGKPREKAQILQAAAKTGLKDVRLK
ncbi:MAG: hypothetical protein HC765_00110 [Brachymonas sp.]|nr:hypothetical protein [Brachymonas sp.]